MKIPVEVGSKYRFIILGGQRVAQLQKGAKPRLEEDSTHMKNTEIAIHELESGKLVFHKIDAVPEETEPAIEDNLVTDV